MNLLKRLYYKFILRKNSDDLELEYRLSRGLTLGNNTHVLSPSGLDGGCPWLITIGDNVTISTNVTILTHDASTNVIHQGTKLGRVNIGNNVFIGTRTVVLCNTTIGDNVIIGAGSVVSHNIPSNGVYAGVPAQYVCSIDEYRKKYQELRKTRPDFDKIMPWYEWKNAEEKDRKIMYDALSDGIGFF